MRKLLYIIPFLFIAFTFQSDNPPGWYELTLPINDQVNDIYFTDSLNGWAVTLGDNSPPDTGYILHTTDGGDNWTVQLNHEGNFSSIQFIDVNTGYAFGNEGFSRFYKTTNSGLNWQNLSGGVPIYFSSDMQFINRDTGWITSSITLLGGLAKTTNGGMNWVEQLDENVRPGKLYFINSDTGWALGSENNLYRTINGGNNWSVQYGFNRPLEDIFFINDTLGFISGSFGIPSFTHSIEKTTDGGFTWDSTFNSKGGLDIFFINTSTGFISGNLSTIQKSTDAGNTWYNQTVPSGNYLSIQFFDTLIGFAGGTKMIKTTDGGGPTSISQISNEIPDKFILFQNYPNPFNPETSIKFKVKSLKNVKLSIYDITGREVDVLVNEKLNAGEYQYTFNGTGLSSGIYFYRLLVDGITIDTKKMMFVK